MYTTSLQHALELACCEQMSWLAYIAQRFLVQGHNLLDVLKLDADARAQSLRADERGVAALACFDFAAGFPEPRASLRLAGFQDSFGALRVGAMSASVMFFGPGVAGEPLGVLFSAASDSHVAAPVDAAGAAAG